MNGKYAYLVGALLLVLLTFCSNPVDIETPRKKTPVDPKEALVIPRISQVVIEENGEEIRSNNLLGDEVFSVEKSEIYVDTLSKPARMWLKLSIKIKKKGRENLRRLHLKGILINLDSLPILNSPLMITNSRFTGSWAKVLLHRSEKEELDTTVDLTKTPNYYEISLSHNPLYREFWATNYFRIYDKYYARIVRDSVVRDSVLKYRYDTTFVDDKPVIKKVEYWEVKEIRIKVEELTGYPDSIFVNFKIRMKY